VAKKYKATNVPAPNQTGYAIFNVSGLAHGGLDLQRLQSLAGMQMAIEDELAEAEAVVDGIKKRLRLYKEQVVPQLFDDAAIKKLTLADDSVVKITSRFGAKIEMDDEEEAYEFLESVDSLDIVKNTFTITFPKEKEKEVRKFIRDLKRRKVQLDWELKRAVHPSTLASWVKERVTHGLPLDFELFNVVDMRTAKIKRSDNGS